MRDLKQKLMDFWNSSKFFRVYFYTLSVVAVLAFVAFGVLSLLAKDRVETAQVLYSKSIKPNDETQKLENYVFVVKLHHFTSYIFRHQRNISLVKNTDFTWSKDINTSAIISIKQETSGADANKFFQIQTSQDLSVLRYTTLGTAQYETSFAPLPKSIVEYYLSLLVLGFVFIILWRHYRKASLYALAFTVFCLVILSLDGAKIEQLHLVPFGLIAFALFAVCVFGAWRVKNSRLKLFLAYFSVIPLCLGIAEFWLFFGLDKESQIPHEILGYANKPLYDGKAKFIVDDKIVFDAHYKHDEFGNRIIPNNNKQSKKCIAVYGGSFAYGSGLDNNETLTSFLAKALTEYKILNFGIPGGGAHTMLARLEFRIDANLLTKCNEIIVIYEAIPHHIHRVYGAFLGPNYKFDSKGNPQYWGVFYKDEYSYKHFHEKPPKIFSKPQEAVYSITIREIYDKFKDILKLQEKLDKSYIQQTFFNRLDTGYKSEKLLQDDCCKNGIRSNLGYVQFLPNEITLYFAIIRRIQEELFTQYNIPLYIVLWDNNNLGSPQCYNKYEATLKTNFRQMGVPFYALSEMIEDYPQDLERVKRGDYDNFKYRISRWDIHPNALANEKIAEFLATKIKNGEIKSHKIKGTK